MHSLTRAHARHYRGGLDLEVPKARIFEDEGQQVRIQRTARDVTERPRRPRIFVAWWRRGRYNSLRSNRCWENVSTLDTHSCGTSPKLSDVNHEESCDLCSAPHRCGRERDAAEMAVYKGSGETNDAANFACRVQSPSER
jgi:hypothetical protein